MADRHYTLDEANAALGWVLERIERLRSARERLTDEEVREALTEAAPMNGGGDPGRAVSEAFLDMRAALAELQANEIVLRDLDRGLVDFPSVIDGQEGYLCWLVTEPEVGHWHGLGAGYLGRRPL